MEDKLLRMPTCGILQGFYLQNAAEELNPSKKSR